MLEELKEYLWNILISADCLVNTIFGGAPKMTMSGRVFLYKDSNKLAYIVYKVLNFIKKNHCESAYVYDLLGANNNDAVLK